MGSPIGTLIDYSSCCNSLCSACIMASVHLTVHDWPMSLAFMHTPTSANAKRCDQAMRNIDLAMPRQRPDLPTCLSPSVRELHTRVAVKGWDALVPPRRSPHCLAAVDKSYFCRLIGEPHAPDKCDVWVLCSSEPEGGK